MKSPSISGLSRLQKIAGQIGSWGEKSSDGAVIHFSLCITYSHQIQQEPILWKVAMVSPGVSATSWLPPADAAADRHKPRPTWHAEAPWGITWQAEAGQREPALPRGHAELEDESIRYRTVPEERAQVDSKANCVTTSSTNEPLWALVFSSVKCECGLPPRFPPGSQIPRLNFLAFW